MTPIIETVLVELATGCSEARFLEACKATNTFLKRQPGFQWRRIVNVAPGRYMDILEWAGQAEADNAMAASMKDPCMAALMECIDSRSVTVAHYPVVAAL